jgi:hypothetical protein
MLNVYDTLANGPTVIYQKQNVKVFRCGELLFFYKDNNMLFKSPQPNRVNSVFIMKIVDRILSQ